MSASARTERKATGRRHRVEEGDERAEPNEEPCAGDVADRPRHALREEHGEEPG
jgi:hypothetical protein